MIQKNLRPNKKLSPKNIGTKNLFVQKKSKMFESNIIVVQKNLGPENLLPSKIGYSNAQLISLSLIVSNEDKIWSYLRPIELQKNIFCNSIKNHSYFGHFFEVQKFHTFFNIEFCGPFFFLKSPLFLSQTIRKLRNCIKPSGPFFVGHPVSLRFIHPDSLIKFSLSEEWLFEQLFRQPIL